MLKRLLVTALLGLFSFDLAAQSQTVRQSGTVTAGHAVRWTANGVIQDGGTAAEGLLTSLGVTAAGAGICQNSDLITAAGFQRICIGATTQGGGVISVQNFGTAPAAPLSFNVNGILISLPAGGDTFLTAATPITSGAILCFSGIGGLVAPCGSLSTLLVAGPGLAYTSPNLIFNIDPLTADTSPDKTNDYIPMRRASDGAMVKINPTTIAAVNTAGVGSIGGLSGTVGVGYGITTSSNNILVDPTAVRVKQVAPVTMYVRTDGNDSNTCLVNSSGGACLTMQAAWNKLQNNYDVAGSGCTVQVADGTYTSTFNPVGMPVGVVPSSQCQVLGNTTTPANVIINVTGGNAVQCGDSAGGVARFTIDGFTLRTTTSGNALEVNAGCFVRLGTHMVFGATAGIHMYGHTGGNIVETTPGYTISGSASYHVFASSSSNFIIHGITITCTGSPVFGAFAYAGTGASIEMDSLTFSGCGGVTGARFLADIGGTIYTGSDDINYFPGDSAGVVNPSGTYNTRGSAPTTASRAKGAALGLTNNTSLNITSISLGAGTWDVSGNCGITYGGSTVASQFHCGIATTTGALPVQDQQTLLGLANLNAAGVDTIFPAPRQFFSFVTTTTVYLVTQVSFTTDTAAAFGNLIAVSHR